MQPADSLVVFEWHPRRLLQETRVHPDESFSLLVLNQPISNKPLLQRLWRNSNFKVAADGGANHLLDEAAELADDLDVIIGDLDSFTDASRRYYASLARPPEIMKITEQDSTDFAKAVSQIRTTRGAPGDIVALGGLGGRVDQGLSQLHHLCLFQQERDYGRGRMYLASAESLTFLLKKGMHKIFVQDWTDIFAKYVGIIPIKGLAVISTKGLEWDVSDWETEFGGRMSTSNHLLPATKVVEIVTDRDVVFTMALK